MEITPDIQWMREENIDGEEKEEAGEEDICEGKSQGKARSEEGSQEVCDKESCQEDCRKGSQETGQENCQEIHQKIRCSSVQGGSEEICSYDKLSRCVQIGRSGGREETCEVFRG
jgi:hypothetical protein